MARMTPGERDLVRRLVKVYAMTPATDTDMCAINAHCENVEQDLPWSSDPARAEWLQDVALRAVSRYCREGVDR